MKLFVCPRCQQILFFENVSCTRCGLPVVYLPDRGLMSGVEPVPVPAPEGRPPAWRALAPAARGALYRQCRNHREHAVCNWAIPAAEPDDYCRSCRLDRTIPNLADPRAHAAWLRLEAAKRWLIDDLLELGLPVDTKGEDSARGLAFQFLEDEPGPDGSPRVFTGHAEGVITISWTPGRAAVAGG